MIVVDSSAVVAIFLREAEAARFEDVLLRSARSIMSAVNAHEAVTVIRRRSGRSTVDLIWTFLLHYRIEIVPFDEARARAAVDAYDRYGKGVDSTARLNLADCAAYALATSLDAPLLFKGRDLSATDVRPALSMS